jgi:hypothetical protein
MYKYTEFIAITLNRNIGAKMISGWAYSHSRVCQDHQSDDTDVSHRDMTVGCFLSGVRSRIVK